MKQKVGTLLEEDVLRRAKRRAADEGRPLSDVIQDALESYLSSRAVEPAKRDAAYQLFCDRPMKLTSAQFRAVLEEDAWDL
jgi:hypothetical protein